MVAIFTDAMVLSANNDPFESVNKSEKMLIIFRFISYIIQMRIFTYGLISAVKEKLSPKRVGFISVMYLVSIIIDDIQILIYNIETARLHSIPVEVSYILGTSVSKILPAIIGAIAAYLLIGMGLIFHGIVSKGISLYLIYRSMYSLAGYMDKAIGNLRAGLLFSEFEMRNIVAEQNV